MAKLTKAERVAIYAYRVEVVALIQQLRQSMARIGAMLPEIGTRLTDPAWRAGVADEARSWRQLLDALPMSPPELANDLHTRALRCFGLAAEVGEDVAASVEGADVERFLRTKAKFAEVVALGNAAIRSANLVAARAR